MYQAMISEIAKNKLENFKPSFDEINKKMSPKICETRCRKPVDLVVFIKTKYFICYANLKDVADLQSVTIFPL